MPDFFLLPNITGSTLTLSYGYKASGNDGRVESMTDSSTVETVEYQYDSLKRLVKAQTTGTQWGQQFDYDGFGNHTAQVVTKGLAPAFSLTVDGLTNRVSSHSYDANGNVTHDGVTKLHVGCGEPAGGGEWRGYRERL